MADLATDWSAAKPVALSEWDSAKPVSEEWNKAVPVDSPGPFSKLAGNMAQGFLLGGPAGAMLRGAATGVSALDEMANRASYNFGGKVTDVASNLGASPEVSAGAGLAANVGLQALPVLAGGAFGAKAAPALEAGARRLMTSAVKPTLKASRLGHGEEAVTTLLNEGVNVSKGGVEKLQGKISALNDQITNALQQSGATVDKEKVAGTIQDVVDRIKRTQSTPQDALAEVDKVYTQFVDNNLIPDSIPVQRAQELKQGIYQMLKDKYGFLGSDTVEAQKALGRGYKEGIVAAVPEVADLNAAESKLINALNVTERRVLVESNKNPMGLALIARSPATWAAFMADRSALFKSLLARTLYSGDRAIPGAGGAAVGAGYSFLKNNAASDEAMRQRVLSQQGQSQ